MSMFIVGTLTAQIRNTNVLNPARTKITLPSKDVKVNVLKFDAGTDYSGWKKGTFIGPNNLGGQDQMFTTIVNESWSVGYAGYNLRPKNGMVTLEIRTQNKKKYMVTVHYSTSSLLKMEAWIQYSSANSKDFDINSTQETLEFSPDKKWPGTFSFIVEPEIKKAGTGAALPEGYGVLTLIQLSIPEIKISESGKAAKDYYLNYLGADIKEIQ